MVVILGIDVVERGPADWAQPPAVGSAQELEGKRECECVAHPGADVELLALDVGAVELLVLARRLVNLAGVDLHRDVGVREAAHAWTGHLSGGSHPDRVSGPRPGQIQARRHNIARDAVALARELQAARIHVQVETPPIARMQGETRQVDAVISRCHPEREVSGPGAALGTPVSAQFHMHPQTYLDEIRSEVPRYDELQAAAIDAVPFAPVRVLELGIGTGETTRRLLDRYPQAEVTGLDSQPEMVFRARELGIEVRLARMEDPLPDGPWDLVISVLSIHHLDGGQKRDLFRRVRAQSRALVMGDVVLGDPQVTPLEEGVDLPSLAEDMVEWCEGEILWRADDLAVIRAVYE